VGKLSDFIRRGEEAPFNNVPHPYKNVKTSFFTLQRKNLFFWNCGKKDWIQSFSSVSSQNNK